MTPEPETGTKIPDEITSEIIDPGRSVIVVSDLHLGGTEDPHTSARFSRFLEFVSGLYPGDRQGTGHDQSPDALNLLPPQKFILLGDFFDLWDPRDQDRNNVLLDAMIPIARLGQMDCDVVFVTGNHDEDIAELIDLQGRFEKSLGADSCGKDTGTIGQENDRVRCLPSTNEGLQDAGSRRLIFQTRPGRKFSIYKGSYIPGPGREGLNVGGAHYAFLHGHQFDPEQFLHKISEVIKQRVDPISAIMDYANTGLAKSMSIPLCFVFPILLLILLIAGWFFMGTTSILFKIAFWILIFITVVISIPRIFAWGKRTWYDQYKAWKITIKDLTDPQPYWSMARDNTADRIKHQKYFKDTMFTLDANAVIFGHTHCADRRQYTIPINEKNPKAGKEFHLINSGSWVRAKSTIEPRSGKPSDPCKQHLDTFVYIDADELRLMKWVEEEAEGMPCRGRVEQIYRIGRESLIARTRDI